MKKIVFPALAVAVLAGCSQPPNDEDVQAAFAAITGKDAAKIIGPVKVIQCQKADEGGYNCDVKTDFGAQRARFVKTGDGWQMIR